MKFNDFTGLYPLSKTLRFEARPVGATWQHIQQSGMLDEDQHRAESYQVVKKLIDEYHKAFIDGVMDTFSLPLTSQGKLNSLEEYLACYQSKEKSDTAKKQFAKIQENLRKAISQALRQNEAFKRIDKKELVETDLAAFVSRAAGHLPDGLDTAQALAMIAEFKGFTTYFLGFHQNRSNLYVAEEQSTAIAYRLVHENLPRFVDNMAVFAQVAAVPEMQPCLAETYRTFEAYLGVNSLGEMFSLGYFNTLLTQTQIEVYNGILGGRTSEDSRQKFQGLNEYINLYNQQHKDRRLPKFKMLYKQILSDRTALSWLPESFATDRQLLEAVGLCYASLQERVLSPGENGLQHLLSTLTTYDAEGIFLPADLQLTRISQKLYGDWSFIESAVKEDIRLTAPPQKKRETADDYEKRIDGIYKQATSFSLAYLNRCIAQAHPAEYRRIEDYFATLGAEESATEQRENLFAQIANAYTEVRPLLQATYPADKKLSQNDRHVELLKRLLDALKSLQHFVKPLLGKGDESGKDERFAGEMALQWSDLDKVTLLYNKVRNHITRKPYDKDKIKLNFSNAQLLAGWDENKEMTNAALILRKDGLYYLAVMNKNFRSLLGKPMPADGPCYERMTYKLLPGANKMLPKVFFSKSRIEEFAPSETLLEHYAQGTHKKGEAFSLADCHELIDFFKQSIAKHPDWRNFGFRFSDTSTYEDLSGFYREVEQQGYKVTFSPVSVSHIDRLVDEGKMYLFQIYNKDFSPSSKGTPNMHTLYWRALFDGQNLADVVYKLNGEAELFFRRRSLSPSRPTHPAGVPIANKNRQNEKQTSTFGYDLTKDRRFTVDKVMFHVPVTLNFKSTGNSDINQQVRVYLQTADDAHVIGIDRGERHLLYLVVIDRHGHIKEQCSLNEIVNEYNGNSYRTNYHDLLDRREKDRLEARQSWKSIETIKELKEGYLSQVIHKITSLMVKYHAIVVLEDLNLGFMRGRQKVEKQVYQKFEKMLIDKLNYLVDKQAACDRPGGLYHAYQLANAFESFRKLGKQSGFLFYIPAWNTSKIDPVTGFVNLFDLRYESVEKAKLFFSKFRAIRYNAEKDWFEFSFDYNAFTSKAEGTRTEWTVCTHGERIVSFRNALKNNQWDSQTVWPTQLLKDLFGAYGIDPSGNLKESIAQQSKKDFFAELLRCLKLTLQMRNSQTGTEIDFLVSPVADKRGNFYDSRTCGPALPANADANGAYNIARKGLMLIDQLRKAKDLKALKFDITNKSWLMFAQQKPYLND